VLKSNVVPTQILSNADIADRLASLAQLLSAQKENPFKVKAWQRAAARIKSLSESLDELVRQDADLTCFPGIGDAIASAIREIVLTGTMSRLERLRADASPELVAISEHPRLDPKRVIRIYKKLGIGTIDALREKLANGEIEKIFGMRMAQHVEQGLVETHAMLLYRADDLRAAVEEFLLDACRVKRVEAAGDYRRRVEVIDELSFVAETDDFPGLVSRLHRYGGRTPLLSVKKDQVLFALSAGIKLRVKAASREDWGLRLLTCTGSRAHLRRVAAFTGTLRSLSSRVSSAATEAELYERFGLAYVEPELREGLDEVERAAARSLPVLVQESDVLGDLHAHSTSSDGGNSIEEMAEAARTRGYEYVGISDHSQSLKIARGVSVDDLWQQIRFIDRLNGRLNGFRILKSAEVDILADGSLDYPDDILRELDYTVCSIHSRFGLNKAGQTERILRAMDNRYFNIMGHATGRLLLKRPGYEIDADRVIEHARQAGCFFEINSSPDRLDLSAENTRRAAAAGVKIAINTDAHSTREFRLLRYGIGQARRAGLEKSAILNCLPWEQLAPLFRR
jgi:DNA polymerase (family 10)